MNLTVPPTLSPSAPPAQGGAALRQLGPFRLLQLLGRSRRSMVWRVTDTRRAREGILALPRVQPADAQSLQDWDLRVRRGARLKHPNLADPAQIGFFERWPFVYYDEPQARTLAEHLQAAPLGAAELAALLCGALSGLAYAHDGGVVHGDVQSFMLLPGESPDTARWIGLELAAPEVPGAAAALGGIDALHAQREAAQADVLAVGLLLHQLLSGRPALEQPDLRAAVERLPPAGRELVRLPWSTPLPVPEAVRAIANRATDRQPRQRYRSARGMARALEGWLQAEGAAGGGPLVLLLERLHAVGALPALPGHAQRVARLALMDRDRTIELAQVLLQDPVLSLELLRVANGAQVRGSQAAGNSAVLTVRRAIAMLGLEGVRRTALGLRPWPGALSEAAARTLHERLELSQRAGRIAQVLRPAGYDAEVVLLVTLLQQLGRLIVAYHFPDEWLQIRRLMQPGPPERPEEPEQPGMDEQAASFAVLGADVDAVGAAVLRHWGMDDAVLHMARRLPSATTPRAIDDDADMLRAIASCANEVADTLEADPRQQPQALQRVAQRYARALGINSRDLRDALAASAVVVLHEEAASVEPQG